jgi:hypothetical protein
MFADLAHLQDEDTESNANCTCSSANCYNIHNEHASPETGLEAIHREKCSRLQRVSEEEDDREDVNEQYDHYE